MTFLSPIEVIFPNFSAPNISLILPQPADFVKQSLPFSYLSVTAAPNDGGSHTVQVYTDISAEWITGNNSLVANWTTTASDSAVIHQTQLVQQQPFVEIGNHIQCMCRSRWDPLLLTSNINQTGPPTMVLSMYVILDPFIMPFRELSGV